MSHPIRVLSIPQVRGEGPPSGSACCPRVTRPPQWAHPPGIDSHGGWRERSVPSSCRTIRHPQSQLAAVSLVPSACGPLASGDRSRELHQHTHLELLADARHRRQRRGSEATGRSAKPQRLLRRHRDQLLGGARRQPPQILWVNRLRRGFEPAGRSGVSGRTSQEIAPYLAHRDQLDRAARRSGTPLGLWRRRATDRTVSGAGPDLPTVRLLAAITAALTGLLVPASMMRKSRHSCGGAEAPYTRVHPGTRLCASSGKRP
jgi:hypothetical protein